MLLEFKASNFKSFADELKFSLIPAPKQKGLDYSVMEEKVGRSKYRGLCSAVIYGPNASGKTNIIGAMDTFSAIIKRGNIDNTEQFISPNEASNHLELIPNCNGPKKETCFSIKFIEDSLLFEYSLKCDLGEFLSQNYSRRITQEIFWVNERQVFKREGDSIDINVPPSIKQYTNSIIKRITPKTMDIANSSLTETELFLTNGFKSIFSKDLVSKFSDWLSKKFFVVYRADSVRALTPPIQMIGSKQLYVDNSVNDAAREFGFNSKAIGYMRDPNTGMVEMYSLVSDKKIMVPSEAFESYGTIRFIHELPMVLSVLVNGGTLVVDEFDASIHPIALMNILNIFHNDEINKKHAQLVFNTHNPIFLDSSLLRRDEIKFVEMDEEKKSSVHYSLSDFRTADGVRKGEDYMHNYFVNRYGAIKDIDFTSIVEKLMEKEDMVNND